MNPEEIATIDNKNIALGMPDTSLMQKNQLLDTLKILFEKKNIGMITSLDRDEINLCTTIKAVGKIKEVPVYDEILNYFFELRLSEKRESRKEVIKFGGGLFGKKPLLNRIKDVFRPQEEQQ